jgi:hypothetical protein
LDDYKGGAVPDPGVQAVVPVPGDSILQASDAREVGSTGGDVLWEPYIDLEMTIQSLLSDGSGGAASDCQLEGGKKEAGVSRKDDQEDNEMGDNYWTYATLSGHERKSF